MFMTLYLREWKEKAGVLTFGIGLVLLYLAAELVLTKNLEARELMTGAVLVFFFPAMALLLGAGGFEPESRHDAWAYLFSRPVGKGTIWAGKYVSLLTQLASLWLVFFAVVLSLPGFRALTAGFRLPVVFGTELNLLQWSPLVSVFFLSIAFSLSTFSTKWLNLLFGALFIGLVLGLIAYASSTVVTVLLPDEWFDGEKWQHAFRWSLVLAGGAAALASFLTLTRVDYSQPRKKMARFAGLAVPLTVAGLVVAAAWTALLPWSGYRFISMLGRSAGSEYFQASEGIFAYDLATEKVTRLARGRAGYVEPIPVVRAGKVAFFAADVSLSRYKPTALWSMNADGSQRTRLAGGGFGPDDPRSRIEPYTLVLSPDGKQVAFFDESGPSISRNGRSPLWVINADGSGLRNLPVPRELLRERRSEYWLDFFGWPAADPFRFLISQRGYGPQGQSRLWQYDSRDGSCRVLVDDARQIWHGSLSPTGDRLVFASQKAPGAPWRLNVVDFGTGQGKIPEVKEVETPGWRFTSISKWSHRGDHLAVFARQGTETGKGGYALIIVSMTERKVLASKELSPDGKVSRSYSADWLNDDTGLVLCDPDERAMMILRADLSEERRIPFPSSAGSLFGPTVRGDRVLIIDGDRYAVWRCDLTAKRWKRIY